MRDHSSLTNILTDIQQKKLRPSAVWKLCSDEESEPRYATSLASANSLQEFPSNAVSSAEAEILKGRTTSPSENSHAKPYGMQLHDRAESSFTEPSIDQKRRVSNIAPAVVTGGSSDKDGLRSSMEPRRFHLSKSLLLNRHQSSVSKIGPPRHRGNRKAELAVFVEKAGSLLHAATAHKGQSTTNPSCQVITSVNIEDANSKSLSKRPIATESERKWRAEHWGKSAKPERDKPMTRGKSHSVSAFWSQWEHGSLELAGQLRQIALEESNIQEERTEETSGLRPPKVKPKPPKPRLPNTQQVSNSDKVKKDGGNMPDFGDPDEDAEYVLDAYVRLDLQSANAQDSMKYSAESLQAVGHDNIGVLVIEDFEEALWDTFGEGSDNDPDWNSDEEDENGLQSSSFKRNGSSLTWMIAEDFYGNDYPEDEVNTDDEFGRDAYNYRHGASEDEEFGVHALTWSDEEVGTKFPWMQRRDRAGSLSSDTSEDE